MRDMAGLVLDHPIRTAVVVMVVCYAVAVAALGLPEIQMPRRRRRTTGETLDFTRKSRS